MPTTLADAHDHFTDVFGNKRGTDRPDKEAPNDDSASGVPCAGGCGALLAPEGHVGPLYCEDCFAAEKKKFENALGCSAPKIVSTEPPQAAPTRSARWRAHLSRLPVLRWLIGPLLFIAFMVTIPVLAIRAEGSLNNRIRATIASHLRAAHPHASQIKCQAGPSYKNPRCTFSEGGSEHLAVFSVGQEETFIFRQKITSVKLKSIRPYNSVLEESREEVG